MLCSKNIICLLSVECHFTIKEVKNKLTIESLFDIKKVNYVEKYITFPLFFE